MIGPLGGGNDSIGRRSEDDPNLVIGALRHLGSGGPDDNEAQAGHLIAHALTHEGHDGSEDGTGRGTPLVVQEAQSGVREYLTTSTLRSDGPGTQPTGSLIREALLVRRLTPTECERLQGFPDGHTCLCSCEPYSTMACRCPDSPRYRALGNAVTVPVIEWIGRRLMAVLAGG